MLGRTPLLLCVVVYQFLATKEVRHPDRKTVSGRCLRYIQLHTHFKPLEQIAELGGGDEVGQGNVNLEVEI